MGLLSFPFFFFFLLELLNNIFVLIEMESWEFDFSLTFPRAACRYMLYDELSPVRLSGTYGL